MLLSNGEPRAGADALGGRLRSIRQRYRVTGADLAEKLGCGQAKISKIEHGKLRPSLDYVRAFSRALSLPKTEARDLEVMTQMFLMEFNRWHHAMQGSAAEVQEQIGRLERDATRIDALDWFVLSGLLQTKRYAEHLFRLFREITFADAQTAVQIRIQRQNILRRRRRHFRFIVAEHVLLTRFCGRDVVVEQINHLRTALHAPNVELRIFPLGRWTTAIPVNGFDIFDDKFVLIEARDFQLRLWADTDVKGYRDDFESIWSASISGKSENADMLENIRSRIEHADQDRTETGSNS